MKKPERPAKKAPPRRAAEIVEDLQDAEVVEEGEWTQRIVQYSVDNVSRALAYADDREEISNTIVRYLGQHVDRVALFLVRGDTVSGWKAQWRGKEIDGFRNVNFSLSRPSVLKTLVEAKSYYLGPIPENGHNARLIAGLGGERPKTALLLPLIIGGRVLNILYVEGGKKELNERVAELVKLLTKASLAFEILILREKVLMI